MHGALASSEAYEFGQLGTGLSWFREYTVPKADEFFFYRDADASQGCRWFFRKITYIAR